MAISGFVDKYSLPQGELPVLSSALMSKYGNNTAYGDVIQTANYEYTVNYKGEGEFDIIEYHTIDNSIKDKYNDREKEEFPESPDRWSSRNGFTEGEYNSNSYDATDREADGYYVGLDQEAPQGEPQQTQGDVSGQEHQRWGTRLIKTGADGTVFPRLIEASDIQLFTSPQGQASRRDGRIQIGVSAANPGQQIKGQRIKGQRINLNSRRKYENSSKIRHARTPPEVGETCGRGCHCSLR